MDIESLIAQTEALSWDDPSSQIESLTAETATDECLPLVGHVISHKTLNNQAVFAALSKAWEFAVPFSHAVLGPNKFLFKLSKPEHLARIQKQVTWNVNGFLIILQQWHPQATLGELPFNKAPFWIQVHGLPLINMTTKIAISIGKGLGKLIKVDALSGEKKTFRSFLRLLVDIEVGNPLKPGFIFRRDGGESLWIFLKYERLDIYCSSCGRIGHKLFHCTAPPEDRFPEKYAVSLQVNIFSNMLSNFPITKTCPAITITQTQPSSSQNRPNELTQSSEASQTPVHNAQTQLDSTRLMQQKISQTFVTSLPTSPSLNAITFIPSTASALDNTAIPPTPSLNAITFIPSTATALDNTAIPPTPHQSLIHPISQPPNQLSSHSQLLKRARLTGDLLPCKKGSCSSPLIAPTPDELESPTPMDSIPNKLLQLPARGPCGVPQQHMKILSWNCRGISRPAAVRGLRALIRANSPDVLFLSETKTSPSQVSSILNRLGFYLMTQVASIGSSGGLVLAWRLGVELESFLTNKNNITAWCYSDPPNSPWILSCIYGPPEKKNKLAFWDSLTAAGEAFVSPWLCIGDFNFVLDQSENLGGRPVASSSHCPFRNFIDQHGMVDLGFVGNPFTWCNNRTGFATIKERLDRGLASLEWVHLHPDFSLIHLPASISDHNPISLNTNNTSSFLPRPFKFEEFWTLDPSCGLVIAATWKHLVSGPPGLVLVKKLAQTKAALKRWNNLIFGNIQAKIKSSLFKIDQIQISPPSSQASLQESLLKKELDGLLIKEESLWRSKSRETWLQCKDLNTRFFHSSTLIRRRSNAVNFLKTNEGAWISDRAEIGGNFVSHFSNLFSSSVPPIEEDMLSLFDPVVSAEENSFLCALPPEEEVVQALSSLGSTKAPGPDGFTALFYKKYWSIVKTDVLVCIRNFFQNHQLQQEQNHTHIALIPKQQGSHSVHHFRPISLCNIVYKIITKILATRLKTLLPKIISPLQSAFVPSRNIQDNTILAHELLHSFKSKKGKGGFMFLHMDMEKAFDKMEWDFILSVMKKLGFHSSWINWIRLCISSSSFSILINGSPFGQFSPKRGLRQGDPLSPFLFILGTEVLSRLLFREETLGNIKGLKISRNTPAIHHLLFADDLLIFGKATLKEANTICSCLKKYCLWSGQSINNGKSSIRFSKNTNLTTAAMILDILPYSKNPSKSIYLGLPILLGNSKKAAFLNILDRVKSKMDGWRAKSLSQAGRLMLINSVATAIPSYAMSTFLLPKSLCSQLDKAFKKFWWGFPSSKTRNLSLKSWNSICTPKVFGGLGIRRMKDVNLALISKLGWKLLTGSDSLWVSQLSGKYLQSESFLSPSSLSSSSWLWKGILKSKPIISQGACHRIHSLSSLSVWNSSWIPTVPFFTPTPLLLSRSSYPDLIVSDLITPNGCWNLPLLVSLFTSPCVKEILKIPISPNISTSFLWTPSSNGNFSTCSAFRLISNSRNSTVISPLESSSWKALWKLKLNARLILFLWKIAWDILPSKVRLKAIFNIPNSESLCPLCSSEEDSLSHLFFRCIFARVAWRSSFWPLDSLAWSSLSLPDWIKGIIYPFSSFGIPKADSHLFQIYASVLCDLLWFSRNKAVHEGIIPDIISLASSIKRTSLDHAAAWKYSSPITVKEFWSPPPAGSHKINFDTAIREKFSVQAAVCRDSKGHIVKAISQINPPCDPIYGEALAAQLAASLAASLKLSSFSLEGDSSVIIDALQNPSITFDWHIQSVIANSLLLLKASPLWEAKKIHRSANFCAHHVAYWAAARVFSGCIPTYFPPPPSIPLCSGKDPPPSLSFSCCKAFGPLVC
ncbi:uncharacterized protein LOC132181647 [Corylus avellana]|uniref:uncharacterized protein LOC132181647 n=1 Tax=Corylus avellana TaxID=13451 RepID=UPI00286CE15E|nr:uncharacterized protein LOC132181647 [Corylus avellana]